ncbi:hypothetical protein K7711_31880 [Nocardia sp. CA2R105]|uniref:hypothetical protein n=1 Tax=Nocardia coffeae TaxID=2873381 RepID=UPI001CA66F39|nr:hypothetical protein [Nocardia coffeae]MBY8861114.1 hypothetical protein [Nocardia coffeae]
MRTIYGEHKTGVDDDVLFTMSVHQASFKVQHFRGKVHVDVGVVGTYCGMQLTVEQAVAFRELLDAGIADAIAATEMRALPAGGDAA